MFFLFFLAIFFNNGYALSCQRRNCLRTYRAVSGDSLYGIAQKLGIAYTSLQTCNPELTTISLYVGQYICTQCSISVLDCSCSKYALMGTSSTWLSIANRMKVTIGYLSDCNPSANIATTISPPTASRICLDCRFSGIKFNISPYYEAVVSSLNANVGPLSSSGLKMASFAFVTGAGSGSASVPSWEGNALELYSSIVNGFSGIKTISFGGSQQGVELAIKFAAAGASADALAEQYKSVVRAYGSNIILDFDIEGGDTRNLGANDLRSKALRLVKATYPGVKITYTLDVGASGLSIYARYLIHKSIQNGVTPDAINIMTMNYGASNRGIDYDVRAIEQTHLQVLSLRRSIRIGVIPMIGRDNSGAVRTVSDIDKLLKFATSKNYIYQFGYWAYHRDVPGTVGVGSCASLAFCADITGFSTGDYRRKFMSFSF